MPETPPPGLVLNPENLSHLEEASRLVGTCLSRTLPDGSVVKVTVGDFSRDGYLDDDDLRFLTTLLSDSEEGNALRARITPEDLAACDLDGDGVVDIKDLLVLVIRLLADARYLARVDDLTGLDNRRAFKEKAQLKINTARRYKIPMACVALDMDRFKQINDQHGHAAGDEALIQVASVLRRATRDSDVICRHGGDEFLALLDHIDPPQVTVVANRILELADQTRVLTPDQVELPIHLSLGVALFDPAMDLTRLMHEADMALYKAKRGGRGRVEFAV